MWNVPFSEHESKMGMMILPATIKEKPGRKCIALGMITRSVEFDMRQWHRKIFEKYGNSNHFSDSVDIHLQFGIADVYDPELKRKIDVEKKAYDDMLIFNFEETEECMFMNRCLIRNHEQIFQGIQHMCDGDYDGAYFVKVDSDSVLNYELMARVIMNLPNESVLFGRLVPNSPVKTQLERLISDSSLSFYPISPQDCFQGYSKDLLQETLKPENMATIYRPDVKYVFPWSDRGTGIQLKRAQIEVKHRVFLKGVYFMCRSESFTCDDYSNSLAFHSGFGLSEKGDDMMAKKIDMMDFIYKTQLECQPLEKDFYQKDHFFFVNSEFAQHENSSHWLSNGCSSLNEAGVALLAGIDKHHENNNKMLRPVNGKCADLLYRKQYSTLKNVSEQVIPHSPRLDSDENNIGHYSKAFKRKMKEVLSVNKDPNYETRLRYIDDGHLSPSLHYYCPDECNTDGSDFKQCASCDLEIEYLKRNPDVAAAVRAGAMPSGFDHYVKFGLEGGRDWSCRGVFSDKEEGTKDGCKNTFARFMEAATPLMYHWPIAGDKYFQMNTPSCNALVIADGRDDPMMETVLKNHRQYLGPYWMFYLVGPKSVTDIWQKYAGPMITIVELPEHFGDLSQYPDEYNTLLLSDFLWKETVQCENVLVSQTDAILFRHGIEDFFDYDYVGSPVYTLEDTPRFWSLVNAFNDSSVGGNGGLSFRKKSAMIKALDGCEIPKPGSMEDAWAVACILLQDGVIPHPVIANRFGIGTKCEVDIPMGCHKLWLDCNTATCVKAIISSRFHRDLYGEENFYYNCPEGESLYLSSYPDIAQAVKDGDFSSGWQHFKKSGQFEKTRLWRCLFRDESAAKKEVD